MKKLSILIMLMCMIMFSSVAFAAEETNETALADETEAVTTQVEEVLNQTEPLLTGEASGAFGDIHKKVLMLTEEAFDYLLTGDEQMKQEFLEEYASLAEDYAAFEKVIDLNSEKASDLKVAYDEMVAATDAMGVAAEKMFASYEANNTVVLEDVVAFEKEVDIATEKAEVIWDLDDDIDEVMTIQTAYSWLSSILLEAIEESYAYPVLGDVKEKEDAMAKFAEFDDILAIAETDNPDVSFEDIKTVKADLLQKAETFFAAYEANGSVSAEDLEPFEAAVESFGDLFVKSPKMVAPSDAATVNLTEESDSAVNTTV